MRKPYLLSAFLLFTGITIGQDWFPSGASWYYNQVIIGSGNTYQHLQVTGDTVIQGKNCKVIRGVCQCSYYGLDNILFQEGELIYIFSPQADSFRLLYDFSLQPGDTMVYRGDEGVEGDGYFLIDSITSVQMGSLNLRVQHITWLDGYLQYGTKIIERIGADGCLYPVVGFCDPGTAGLRCYEDTETGLIHFQAPAVPCDFVSSTSNPDDFQSLHVYPNPTFGILHIESAQFIKQIELFNSLSIPCYPNFSIINTFAEINMESLPPGIYYLKVTTSDYRILLKPIVLQNE